MARFLAQPPIAFAHRGGPGVPGLEDLENTVTAFSNAVDIGCGYLETDVHATRDGYLVAFHDDVLDRVTDRQGAVADLTWPQLQQARIGGREPIPTLDELLHRFPRARFAVDLKAPGTPQLLWRVIDAHGGHHRVCVGSFSNRRLWQFRRLARGQVATAAGRLGIAALRFLPWPVSRFLHSPGVAYSVPWTVGRGRRRLTVPTPGFIRRAHLLRKQVHVWTINDPDDMRTLLDLGVDGIITDRPDLLRDVLETRGQWQPPANHHAEINDPASRRDNTA